MISILLDELFGKIQIDVLLEDLGQLEPSFIARFKKARGYIEGEEIEAPDPMGKGECLGDGKPEKGATAILDGRKFRWDGGTWIDDETGEPLLSKELEDPGDHPDYEKTGGPVLVCDDCRTDGEPKGAIDLAAHDEPEEDDDGGDKPPF